MKPEHSGFTYVELLVVLAIFAVLLGALFEKIEENQEVSAISSDESDMHQNLEDVLTLIAGEMKMTGFPPASYRWLRCGRRDE